MAAFVSRLRLVLIALFALCIGLAFIYSVYSDYSEDPEDSRVASIGQNRWHVTVELRKENKLLCNGVIVASGWVLTTATCIDSNYDKQHDRNLSRYQVRSGSERRGQGGVLHRIDYVQPQTSYRPGSEAYDPKRLLRYNLALIHVKDRFVFSSTCFPIRLPEASDGPLLPGASGFVIGYDFDKADSQLREQAVRVLGSKECDDAFQDIDKIVGSESFCAEGACEITREITGAPLVIAGKPGDEVLAGFVTYSDHCSFSNVGVYFNVSIVADWIHTKLRLDNVRVEGVTTVSN